MDFASEKYAQECESILQIGVRLWNRELVAAHDGNISLRLPQSKILCTPTGVSKGFMVKSDLVITDSEGNNLYGTHEASSELKMHLAIYRNRPDINAIIHAHPPHATAFAVNGLTVPQNVMLEIDALLGNVPTVEYRPAGTHEFAELVAKSALKANVFLLQNHGATTCGHTLEQAWFRMEALDHCCKILLLANSAGNWNEIPRIP